MIYAAITLGALIGLPVGVFAAVLYVEKRRYGTWPRAWCRVVHRRMRYWRQIDQHRFKCSCCGRPFKRQTHWGY